MPDVERFLRRTEAAKYIAETHGFPCSPNTLAKLACIGSDGPRFRLAGRIPLYPVSELDAWAQAKIGPLVSSTSEATMMKAASHLAIYENNENVK